VAQERAAPHANETAKEHHMYREDGSNGARARSARIRASHDGEATQLDSMRRRSATLDATTGRVRWWRSPAAPIVRLLGRHARRAAHDDVGATETADATGGAR
jgi:hypothetical protein